MQLLQEDYVVTDQRDNVVEMMVGRWEGIRIIESLVMLEPTGGFRLTPTPATQPAYERELRPSRLNKLTKALHDADSRLVGPVALSENGTYGAKCFIWRSE